MHTKKILLLQAGLVLAALLLVSILYFVIDARHTFVFPSCLFHKFTGLYCPGCGSQRAISALLHGQVMQAIGYNALFMACLPLLIYSGIISLLNIFYQKQWKKQLLYSPLFVKIFLGVVVIFWLLRNIPLYPFSVLAPHA